MSVGFKLIKSCAFLTKALPISYEIPIGSLSGYQRTSCSFTQRRFCSAKPLPKADLVSLYFIKQNGDKVNTKAKIGDNLLDTIVNNNVDIDGYGACEGTLACSTCHLIFTPENFNKLSDKPSDEELDMLDLAYGLTDYSRLGCQVIVSKEMDGWEIKVPAGVADARS